MQRSIPFLSVVRSASPHTTLAATMVRLTGSSRALAILALIATNAIWGTTFVATKPMLDRIPPLTTASARFAIALLVLLPFILKTGGRIPLGRGPAIMGLTGGFLLYLFQNTGLLFTSAANGSLIHGAVPVLTALLAAGLIGERLGGRRLGGIALSLTGVIGVVLLGANGQVGLSLLGDLLLLVSALSLGGYIVAGRHWFPSDARVLELVAGTAVYGLLFLLPASAIEIAIVGMPSPTTGDVARLIYMGVFASALAFVLWGYGLRHLEAGQAAVFANLTPLVGLAVAALLIGEPIKGLQLAGGGLILAGVWLVTRADRVPTPMPVATAPSPITVPESVPAWRGWQVR